MSIYGINLGKNKEQIELARLIQENNKHIIFCEGCAGTGKTFVSIACALQMVQDKKYKHIYYTRSVIPVGKDIGFLPGDADDKIKPYMQPLLDALESIAKHQNKGSTVNTKDMLEKFDIAPISFIRGRNIPDDSILIIDEAQNCDLLELQTILTRGCDFSKIILLGSTKQIDDPKQARKDKCDFQRVYEELEGLPYVGYVQLIQSMRSPWCREVDEILEKLKKGTV